MRAIKTQGAWNLGKVSFLLARTSAYVVLPVGLVRPATGTHHWSNEALRMSAILIFAGGVLGTVAVFVGASAIIVSRRADKATIAGLALAMLVSATVWMKFFSDRFFYEEVFFGY